MTLEAFRLPLDWGNDELSMLMEKAYRNRVATFVNKPEFKRLSAINDAFAAASKDWLNPTSEVGALLLIRAHSAYFSACEKAAASSLADMFPLLRACLEYAAYCLMVSKDPSLADTWLKRHDSEANQRAVKKTFTTTAMRTAIRAVDQHAERVFHRLYEDCIDFGGHPNERAVTGNLQISDTDVGREIHQLWFHGDGTSLDYALLTASRVGVCTLTVLQNAFPARFELLGINARVLELRSGL